LSRAVRKTAGLPPAAKCYAHMALVRLLLSAPYQSAKGAFAAGHLILDWAGSLFVDSPWLGPVRHDVGWNKTYLCAFGALRIILHILVPHVRNGNGPEDKL
jgi:hypothetical protein